MEFFGIQSTEHLFSEVDTALSEFKTLDGTTFRNLFFLLSALNHLREWIAPGYKHSTPANTENEKFFNSIYNNCQEWKIVNSLCNGLKHINPPALSTTDNASPILKNIQFMSGVNSLELGHPQKFTVEGRDVVEILISVRDYYEKEWFEKQISENEN